MFREPTWWTKIDGSRSFDLRWVSYMKPERLAIVKEAHLIIGDEQ